MCSTRMGRHRSRGSGIQADGIKMGFEATRCKATEQSRHLPMLEVEGGGRKGGERNLSIIPGTHKLDLLCVHILDTAQMIFSFLGSYFPNLQVT